VNLSSTPTTPTSSPVNLAMPRLLGLQQELASNHRPVPAPARKPPLMTKSPPASDHGGWSNSVQRGPPASPLRQRAPTSKSVTQSPTWSSVPAKSPPLRPRSSTSLTAAGARSLSDSIPPLRIARPQHLQAQMKQALNPPTSTTGSKLNVVRSTVSVSSPVTLRMSSTGGSGTSRLERNAEGLAGGAAVTRADSAGRSSTLPLHSSSKLLAAAGKFGTASDQSALATLKLASSAPERRPSNDTGIPVNTLKV